MPVTKITEISSAFPFDDVQNVLTQSCQIYIAKGSGATAPATKTANLAEHTGETAVYVPFGKMNDKIGEIKHKQNTTKIDFGTIITSVEVTATLNSITINPEMLNFLDSQDVKAGTFSLKFVPKLSDGSTWLVLDGVSLASEGNISLGGDLSTITITASAIANKITDIIKYAKLTS